MKSFITIMIFASCAISLGVAFSFPFKLPFKFPGFASAKRVPPEVVSKEWTAFVQRAQAHTDPKAKPIALAFSGTINPMVQAYATKNVPELTRIFKSYLENGKRLLPHIQSPKMRKAMEKILANDKKLLDSKIAPGSVGMNKIDKFVAKVHKIVMKTVGI